ncbi:hypothetical protein A1O7_00048 [Cladophialophora yegresii CBS 114405]|uniref:Uncharacterized protein n=1 Tax=Cladophialophora yegresii CBS 114405 TaxID=1182544 RepID=W9W6W1_9EURO|nr:uncharacterized protein A1O7_00048 [Cladophialophora yegresii CBS 114405]EXJ63713.1 hypothetical protein A1O7_00048 [Cladophialophora yegresii CBS 114405]
MTEQADSGPMIEPIKASILLELEDEYTLARHPAPSHSLPVAHPKGILLPGLDKRISSVWVGGHVVGVGSLSEVGGATPAKRSLPLHVLATALLSSATSPEPDTLRNVYIIAPHALQTVPMLHALLANTISDSQAAIELLKPVRLLQYFDLAGIAESVAEVSDSLYRDSQKHERQCRTGHVHNLVLVQGIGPTVFATYRRSNLLQANALLASLCRNITQLSRSLGDILVMVEFLVEVEEADNMQQKQDAVRTRTARSMVLDSAFLGPRGETLRLASCHESLSRTLAASWDSVVAVHDGLGRITDNKSSEEYRDQVVEVIKDRSGNLTGLWDVWKEAR